LEHVLEPFFIIWILSPLFNPSLLSYRLTWSKVWVISVFLPAPHFFLPPPHKCGILKLLFIKIIIKFLHLLYLIISKLNISEDIFNLKIYFKTLYLKNIKKYISKQVFHKIFSDLKMFFGMLILKIYLYSINIILEYNFRFGM